MAKRARERCPAGPEGVLGVRRQHRILVGIVAAALLVRMTFFVSISASSMPDRPKVLTETDEFAFYQWAQTIAAGDWLGRDTYHPYFDWMSRIAPLETWHQWWGGKEIFHQTPVYPYFVAVILALGHDSVRLVLLAQLLLGILQPVVLYFLAARLFDRSAGLAAAGMAALYGPFIFQQGVLLRDWIPPILEPLGLLLLLKSRQSGRGWGWAGAVFGASLLVKETALVLIPFVLAWLFLEYRGRRGALARSAGWLAAGFVLALLPLVARNIAVGAPAFALSNRGAEVVALGLQTEHHQGIAVLQRSRGGLVGAAMETLRNGVRNIRSLMATLASKLQQLWGTFENADNISFYYGQDRFPLLRLLLTYAVAFPLGLAGLIKSLSSWRKYFLIYAYGAATAISLLVTIVRGRYRLTLVSVLILFAAFLVSLMAAHLREKKWRPLAASVALILACGLGQQAISAREGSQQDPIHAIDYLGSARIYARNQRYDRAAEEMASLMERSRRAGGDAAVQPLNQAQYLVFRAHHLIGQDRRPEARKELESARALIAAAAEPPGFIFYELGQAFLRLNDPDNAVAIYRRFLELESRGPVADEVRRILTRLTGTPW